MLADQGVRDLDYSLLDLHVCERYQPWRRRNWTGGQDSMDGSAMSTPSRPSARPVMADVAQQAGVSHQTAPRVLHGHPYRMPKNPAISRPAIPDIVERYYVGD